MKKYCQVCEKAIKKLPIKSQRDYERMKYCSERCRDEGAKGRKLEMDTAPDGGLTFAEIGERMGFSRQYAKKVYDQALLKFIKQAKKLGVAPCLTR